ncbi:MAG: DEAD/DEAH box helicase [Planctomycetota bacterium]|nr:DEAD/DEAH box helicase [Planctomycetota bacterium]
MPTPEVPTEAPNGFATLGIAPELLAGLTTLGYEEPTPIQRAAIPALIGGRDLLGQAATGTGKTAAFALPLLHVTPAGPLAPGRPRALVLVPTRELAMQVAAAIHKYGKVRNATVLPIYGGQSIWQQIRVLDRGVEAVVATPGRTVDHLERGTLVLDDVRLLVLDEADEMLDMGFAEDLEKILSRAPATRQTALFSATMAPRIKTLANRHLKNPVQISIERERTAAGALPRVKQIAYVVQRAHKLTALGRVLDMETPTSAIVFCRTRLEVDEVTESMNARGYRAEALHGGFPQEQRDRVMARFRDNRSDLLVATDVAARGLDIDHVSHVVNFDVPTEPESYVHRIGRTGRAGREGVAITFVEPREQRLLRNIQDATRQRIPVETIPTVADLRNRRLELTRASLRETVLGGDLDAFRSVVEGLASELDLMDVAAAAVKLAHEAQHAASGGQADDQDVPFAPPREERRESPGRPAWTGPGPAARGPKARGGIRAPNERGPAGPRDRGPRPNPRDDAPRGGPRDEVQRGGFETTRIHLSAGRFQSLRPGDLVGAIAGETGLPAGVVGAIEIADQFSLVDVAAEHAERIVEALSRTKIRGRRVTVRIV